MSLLLFTALLSGSSLLKEKKVETPKSETNVATADTVIAPVVISTSFESKYPNATKVIWYKYNPEVTYNDPTEWYYILDNNDYYVTFYWNDEDYIAWYDDGNWIRSSKTIDDIELPANVWNSINKEFPNYKITDVDMEHDKNQSLYEVKMVKGENKWNIHYKPDGTVFKKKQKSYSKVSPQNPTTTDFNTRFPNANAVTWYYYVPDERVTLFPGQWNYNMDSTDYEVRFKWNGSDYTAWYDNGQWVRTETMMKGDNNKLPAAVKSALKSQYSEYSIDEIEEDQKHGQTVYEIKLMKGDEKCKVHYTSMGAIVKRKCK